jgi:CheY-like chemotaxis protein
MVKFEISDTGIGIATSDQGKLFQPFVQVDCSSTRRFGGTGLGLAICKRLVEVMNGAIGLESTPGKGSKFWFVLPFGCNNNLNTRDAEDKGDADLEKEYNLVQTLPAEDSVADISQDQLLVLLVEDDPVARKLAQYQLNKLGYQSHVVVNGREAVYAATNNNYDLILMDCQLPIIDGFHATRAIREAEIRLERHVPIIAMTARAMAEDKELCMAAGMDDYITKPVELQKLRGVLDRWALNRVNE